MSNPPDPSPSIDVSRVTGRFLQSEDSITTMVEAGLTGDDLAATVSALCNWWLQHTPGGSVLLAIEEVAWPHIIAAVARPDHSAQMHRLERNVPDGGQPLRERLSDLSPSGGEPIWSPLGDRGHVIGGLLISAPASPQSETPPQTWVDLTARLLAAARNRSQRMRDQKLSAMAEFAAGAGHEINNPLGSILGRVQLLAREEAHPERHRMLATIGAQALRVRDMISDTMLFARPPIPHPQPRPLRPLLDEVSHCFEADCTARGVRIEINQAGDIQLLADAAQLRVVISELLRNAIHAAPDGSTIEVSACQQRLGRGSYGVLRVADVGGGLSDLELEHLFDPFFSGRQAGRGLGFGLSKCWRIVTNHHGFIGASNLAPGVEVTLHWPLA